MSPDGDSFLPRIQSVFYAVFDVRQGPKVVYQVPEGLIATSNPTDTPPPSANNSFSPPPLPTSEESSSRASSSSQLPQLSGGRTPSQLGVSPLKRSTSTSATRMLFNFDDIKKYVIPPSPLCGRLVICTTRRHKIIGFPVELKGSYARNYFRYNLCFVFDRTADLSCYEPIVRKVSRVLTSCEEESAFLSSSPESIYGLLEQLYEDLNSYSETSIPIDQFNSIELKIFPFYPNPPTVRDWAVPIALIDLRKRQQPNWDLTVVKVCQYIDGVNHVKRIADLADCDLDLARQAISHLLYYQVVMMIDVFQYSNMYTLRKSVQWLADEAHVHNECGPYVTKPGREVPDWPKLLRLYSRLKPGKTVAEWMQEQDIQSLGIDVRRFTSFGVIKGFLHRVHRWPILLAALPRPPNSRQVSSSSIGRARGKSSLPTSPITPTPPTEWSSIPMSPDLPTAPTPPSPITGTRGRTKAAASASVSVINAVDISAMLNESMPALTRIRAQDPNVPERKSSAAEQSLEQLHRRAQLPQGQGITTASNSRNSSPQILTAAPKGFARLSDLRSPEIAKGSRRSHLKADPTSMAMRPSRTAPVSAPDRLRIGDPLAPFSKHHDTPRRRPRLTQSPSAPMVQTIAVLDGDASDDLPYPKELLPLLDGEHHTDELCVKFEIGWPKLEQWLVSAGQGKGDGDFGRVFIIYR